jgi:hypothetical protein
MQTSGSSCRENAKLYSRHCERSEAIHRHLTHGRMDCFAALAMTAGDSGLDHGCRSAILVGGLWPAACRGNVDAIFEGFTTYSDRAACLTN